METSRNRFGELLFATILEFAEPFAATAARSAPPARDKPPPSHGRPPTAGLEGITASSRLP
jgi:hypothetical protein